MTPLAHILSRLADRSIGGLARSWTGARPEPGSSMIAAIAAKAGLLAEGREEDFTPLSRADAELWLMLFASQSLLHPGVGSSASNAEIEELAAAFRMLGPDAVFFSKGRWESTRRGKRYERATAAGSWARRGHRLSFASESDPLPPIDVIEDGGIIGFDGSTAFIFWVEEDD